MFGQQRYGSPRRIEDERIKSLARSVVVTFGRCKSGGGEYVALEVRSRHLWQQGVNHRSEKEHRAPNLGYERMTINVLGQSSRAGDHPESAWQ